MLGEIVIRTVVKLELEIEEAMVLRQLVSPTPASKLLNTQEVKLRDNIYDIINQLV